MPIREPVGAIIQLFNSGIRADDRLEYIRCVGGQQPQIHEVWTFSDDGITCEVDPFAHIDVGAFSGDCFQTYYFSENGRIVSIYGQKSINGSVEWLGVPHPFYDDGPPWTDNFLCPSPLWGDGVRVGAWAWGIQPGGLYGGVDVPWRGAVPDCADYLPGSLENAHATARRVRDARLRDHRLARAQSVLYLRRILWDHLVNRTDYGWDGLWDEPADQ